MQMERIKKLIIEKIQKSNLDIKVVIKEDVISSTNQLLLESTANYEPLDKTIYISMKKIKEMLSTIEDNEKVAYIDCLIAHELGHASDVEVERSWNEFKKTKETWRNLVYYIVLKRTSYDNTITNEIYDAEVLKQLYGVYVTMKTINLELESRAGELGRNFSDHPTMYEKFNENNRLTYLRIYKVFEEILNII